MTAQLSTRPGPDRRPPRPEPRVPGGQAPRTYATPRLRVLGDAASLLELLGPAQANYGGFGP